MVFHVKRLIREALSSLLLPRSLGEVQQGSPFAIGELVSHLESGDEVKRASRFFKSLDVKAQASQGTWGCLSAPRREVSGK